MSSGLSSGNSGFALGRGLFRSVSGLWSGARGFDAGFGGTPAPTVPFSSVNADGWSVEYTTTPGSLNPLDSFAVTQPGFDDTGNVTTVSETLTGTQRVRLAFPNQTTLASNRVALSGELLASTTLSGVTNNSTLVSPQPIVNWVMPSRVIVGDTIRVGVTGNHWAARSGRPFRCVVFTATDGTNSVTATVTTMSVSTTGAGDLNAVLAYETTLNIASLANPSDVTVNAKVYPWVGTAASVADSALNTGHREFSPRVFRRDTARLAAPNVVYVAAGGNDTTAYVGTDRVAAAAAPALTPNGAINRAATVLGTGAGALDGLEVNLTAGTWVFSTSPTARTTNFCITITPAPGATKVGTIYQFGAANVNPNQTYLRFKGLTISRQGAFNLYNNAVGLCIIEDCTFDATTFTGAISTTAGATFFWNGVVCPSAMGQILTAANPSFAMLRGVDVPVSLGNFHGFLVLGSRFQNGGVYSNGTYSNTNSIIQFNTFRAVSSGNAVVNLQATFTGFSFSQNLVEVTHTTTTTPSLRPSSDNVANSLTHVLFDNNTVAAGHFQVGRLNFFYDETPFTYRTHTFCRVRNTIAGSLYNKGDVFIGTSSQGGGPYPADAPLHTGNWAQLYAVGWKNIQTLFSQPGTNTVGESEGVAYPGLGSAWGTGIFTPSISLTAGVNFTNWTATTTNSGTSNPIAGTIGGDYTLPVGSALLSRVAAADEVFPFDLAGVARTRGSIGAYA